MNAESQESISARSGEDAALLLDSRFHVTLLTVPTAAVLVFTVLPLLYMILLAFTSYDHNHLPPKNLFDWIGLSNFGKMLGGNIAGTFFPLLVWTLIWAFFATFSSFLGGRSAGAPHQQERDQVQEVLPYDLRDDSRRTAVRFLC